MHDEVNDLDPVPPLTNRNPSGSNSTGAFAAPGFFDRLFHGVSSNVTGHDNTNVIDNSRFRVHSSVIDSNDTTPTPSNVPTPTNSNQITPTQANVNLPNNSVAGIPAHNNRFDLLDNNLTIPPMNYTRRQR